MLPADVDDMHVVLMQSLYLRNQGEFAVLMETNLLQSWVWDCRLPLLEYSVILPILYSIM